MSQNLSIQPYLFFGGRCEEALEFYQSALGAGIGMVMRYRDNPDPSAGPPLPPGFEDKIMHASFDIGGSTLMASDGCGEDCSFNGFSLSLRLPDEAACQRVFSRLLEDGHEVMPLGKTFWSPCFGMVTDRFGLCWMITVPD